MPPIDLDVDAYGSLARRSAIADVAELRAWHRPLPLENLADYLHDRGIRPQRERLVPLEEDDVEAAPDEGDATSSFVADRGTEATRSREAAQQVFELIEERAAILDDAYPFRIADGVLVRKRRTICGYDIALTLTLRHAYLRDRAVPAEFERYVARCLAAKQWIVFPIADRVRAAKGRGVQRLRQVIESARTELRWPRHGTGMVPRQSHDRGSDLLARWPPVDSRPGCRTTIFQATVGSSETWARKLAEAPEGSWRHYIGDPLDLAIVLAVPHHVEPEHLHEIIENGNGRTVFDRLRLVAHGARMENSARDAAHAVFLDGVEW